MLLPTVKLGGYEVSRLIVGGNPFSGNSHVSPEMDSDMEDYFTTDRIKQTLFRCEECGINTMQLRADKHIFRVIREFRLDGGTLNWIAQTAPEMSSFQGNINQIMRYDPIAVYHHGTVTDSLFKQKEFGEITKRLAVIRATGRAVGLGTHMPEVIEYSEEHGWDVDFYMASLHNLSKIDRVSSAVTGRSNAGEPFDDEDRALMLDAIAHAAKPCLAFKILGATRKCGSPQAVRAAFEEAFARIKPTDAVVVGMYPKTKDQVCEDAGIVRDILSGRI